MSRLKARRQQLSYGLAGIESLEIRLSLMVSPTVSYGSDSAYVSYRLLSSGPDHARASLNELALQPSLFSDGQFDIGDTGRGFSVEAPLAATIGESSVRDVFDLNAIFD